MVGSSRYNTRQQPDGWHYRDDRCLRPVKLTANSRLRRDKTYLTMQEFADCSRVPALLRQDSIDDGAAHTQSDGPAS